MIIIGEKINGTRPEVAAAVARRDAAYIQDLALRQVNTGAHYLDLNAGTPPEEEPADLAWLVDTVQAVVNVPLCLDSSNPVALSKSLDRVSQKPLINSISGEDVRLENILPLVRICGCPIIALLLDEGGIPFDVDQRLVIAHKIIQQLRQAGLRDEDIFVDPLVLSIATDNSSALKVLETVRALKTDYPAVRFSLGLSNISYGLPARSLINRVFLALAMEVGIDAVIIDPLDQGIYSTIVAAELLLNRDPYCRNYTRSFRAGKFTA